jgi:hypothetical protein
VNAGVMLRYAADHEQCTVPQTALLHPTLLFRWATTVCIAQVGVKWGCTTFIALKFTVLHPDNMPIPDFGTVRVVTSNYPSIGSVSVAQFTCSGTTGMWPLS